MIILSIATLYASCKTEPDSQAIKKELMNIHDKLMADGAKVVNNRMELDSLLKSDRIQNNEDSLKITDLVKRLNGADEKMMDWMHFFKDDFKGKNEAEDLNYFKTEMVKIRGVEDDFIKVTRESDSVLKVYNIKPNGKMYMGHHKH